VKNYWIRKGKSFSRDLGKKTAHSVEAPSETEFPLKIYSLDVLGEAGLSQKNPVHQKDGIFFVWEVFKEAFSQDK